MRESIETETPGAGVLCEIPVRVVRLPGHDDLPYPQYATSGSAGADLCAAITEPVTVRMGEVRLIPTGLRLAIPSGYEGQVRPRSGLALKSGLTLVNSPGATQCNTLGPINTPARISPATAG